MLKINYDTYCADILRVLVRRDIYFSDMIKFKFLKLMSDKISFAFWFGSQFLDREILYSKCRRRFFGLVIVITIIVLLDYEICSYDLGF